MPPAPAASPLTPEGEKPQQGTRKPRRRWRKRIFLLALLLLLLLVSCGLLEGTLGSVVTVMFDLTEESQDLLGGEVWEGGSLEELQRLAKRGDGTVPHGETAEITAFAPSPRPPVETPGGDVPRFPPPAGEGQGEGGQTPHPNPLPPGEGSSSAPSLQPTSTSSLRSARSLPSQASSASPASSAAPPPPPASSAQSANPDVCVPSDILSVRLRSPAGDMLVPSYHFENGRATVSIDDRRFRPGFYTLLITRTNTCTGESRTSEQSFPWGVLAMNTDADRYRPGETGRIDFGVLDEEGAIVCDADLTLTVTAPDGSQSVLSTANGGIRSTGTCGIKEAGFRMPDYDAHMTYEQEGTYRLHLFARRQSGVLKDSAIDTDVTVASAPPFIVRRTAATRLWPAAASVVDIEVEFVEDFAGTIEERVPLSFAVSGLTPTGTLRADPSSGEFVLRWAGSWTAGETAAFSYTFDAPDVSPDFYLLGPLQLTPAVGVMVSPSNPDTGGSATLRRAQGDTVWQELRSWQIANDNLDGATRAKSTTYQIVSDVVPAGGGEDARSTNYMLADTIGEPNIGPSRSNTYELNAGYRQTIADAYLGLTCDDTAALGTISVTGRADANINCTVVTDSEAGYTLAWTEGLPTGNLVGHWKLDDATAGTFVDSSGNGNNGTGYGAGGSNNTPQPDAGVYSPYYSVRSTEFDGTDDYIGIDGGGGLNNLQTGTISMWVKWSGTQDGGFGGSYGPVLARQSNGVFSNQIIALNGANPATAKIIWRPYSAGSTAITSMTSPGDGSWRHIAITYQSGDHKLYVNGVLDGSSGTTGTINNNSNIPLFIGAWAGDGTGYSTSMIDDVRVYDTALTLGQIQELASQSPPGALVMSGSQTTHLPSYHAPTAGLVGHWKMDETAAGSTVLDWSGSGNDGTPTGAGGANNKPQPSTTVPTGTNFENGRSLDFDGTDDYVDTTGNVSYSDDQARSVSVWFKANSIPVSSYGFVYTTGTTGCSGSDFRKNFDIMVGYSNKIYLHTNGNAEGTPSGDDLGVFGTISTGQWYHATIVYDGTTAKGYLNGSLGFTDTVSLLTTQSIARFGRARLTCNDFYFSGLIDDVRIYNRALSAEEIKALYASTQSWSVAANQAFWGARLSSTSTDTDSKWGTDGSSDQWLFIGDGSFPLVTRTTRTDPAGSTELLNVRAEVGATKVQQAGAYRRTIMITVVPL